MAQFTILSLFSQFQGTLEPWNRLNGLGLGAKLTRDALALAGTGHVEMAAVMAKYNPPSQRKLE